jgi:hypothetical protein
MILSPDLIRAQPVLRLKHLAETHAAWQGVGRPIVIGIEITLGSGLVA